MNSGNIRFKSLLEANVKEEVVFQKERDNLRQMLMKVKYNRAPLFIRVEQGTGSKQNNVHVLFSLKLKQEVIN